MAPYNRIECDMRRLEFASTLIFLMFLLVAPLAKAASPTDLKHQTFEVKLTDKELEAELTASDAWGLPQLRVYDKQGRQVGAFKDGFDVDTFAKKLDAILRNPSPTGALRTLDSELKHLTDKDGNL
jgi:hypothetical protein